MKKEGGENDIEVGEYVRTTYGIIAKIIENISTGYADISFYKIDNEIWDNITFDEACCSNRIVKDEIAKHSKNIIDILEVGDIITTKYISTENIKKNELIYIFDYDFLFSLKLDPHFDENIISILTHEQYEANAYRLEE